MTDLSELSVIIVSWNVRALLAACLASLPREAQVIVIDNASADGSADMVSAEFAGAQLIANSENRGFTGGNNQGLALARGRWILLLNPDTIVQGDALESLVAYLQANPEVGVAGPQLRYGDGSLQSSRRRFPNLATAMLESTPLAWHLPPARNQWAKLYHMADRPADTTQEVDWLVGAALLVRREVVDQVGGFDERFFMYSEELDWQRRIRQAGWRIAYVPAAVVTHFEGKSSEQMPAARHIMFNTSKVRYFRKHHGAAQAHAIRLALLGMFAVEWMLESAKYVLGPRRGLRLERMRAYARLLKSGLH